MKKILAIAFLILIGQMCLAQSELKLYAGKGVGAVKIKKTKAEEVRKIYGLNYKLDSSSTDYVLNYSVLGLKFGIDPQTNKVIYIIAYSGFQGETEKGIQLNKSTFRQAAKKYGRPQLIHGRQEVMYIYKGITFTAYCDCNHLFNFSKKLTEEDFEKLAIQEIGIGKKIRLKKPIHIE